MRIEFHTANLFVSSTYVNPVPAVTGAPNLVKLRTPDCKQVIGGLLNVETDAVKAADAMLGDIVAKKEGFER